MNRFKFRVWIDNGMLYLGKGDLGSLAWDLDCAGIDTAGSGGNAMQWTGLLDKNGLEIYEGDIVNYKYESSEGTKMERTSTIEFANGSFGPLPYDNTDEPEYYTYKTYDFKVIGNIYEHPELLEVV